MFAEELADLKDRYPARLHLIHVLSREPSDSALLSGRLDARRLGALLDLLVDPSTVDEWFLCGPYAMVLAAQMQTMKPTLSACASRHPAAARMKFNMLSPRVVTGAVQRMRADEDYGASCGVLPSAP